MLEQQTEIQALDFLLGRLSLSRELPHVRWSRGCWSSKQKYGPDFSSSSQLHYVPWLAPGRDGIIAASRRCCIFLHEQEGFDRGTARRAGRWPPQTVTKTLQRLKGPDLSSARPIPRISRSLRLFDRCRRAIQEDVVAALGRLAAETFGGFTIEERVVLHRLMPTCARI